MLNGLHERKSADNLVSQSAVMYAFLNVGWHAGLQACMHSIGVCVLGNETGISPRSRKQHNYREMRQVFTENRDSVLLGMETACYRELRHGFTGMLDMYYREPGHAHTGR